MNPVEIFTIIACFWLAVYFLHKAFKNAEEEAALKRYIGKKVTIGEDAPYTNQRGKVGMITRAYKSWNGQNIMSYYAEVQVPNVGDNYHPYNSCSVPLNCLIFDYPDNTLPKEPVQKGGDIKMKVRRRLPRTVRWALYIALIVLVWHVVLNIDNITSFVIHTFFVHSIIK